MGYWVGVDEETDRGMMAMFAIVTTPNTEVVRVVCPDCRGVGKRDAENVTQSG